MNNTRGLALCSGWAGFFLFFVMRSTCPHGFARSPFQITFLCPATQDLNPGRQTLSSGIIIMRSVLGLSLDWKGPLLHGQQDEAKIPLPFPSPSPKRNHEPGTESNRWFLRVVISSRGSPPSLSPCESALSDQVNPSLRQFMHNTCEVWCFLTCRPGKEIFLPLSGWAACGETGVQRRPEERL